MELKRASLLFLRLAVCCSVRKNVVVIAFPLKAVTMSTNVPVTAFGDPDNMSQPHLPELRLSAEERPFRHWKVWKTIDRLLLIDIQEKNEGDNENDDKTTSNNMMREPYKTTTLQVVSILEDWGPQWAGQSKWSTLLHKKTLHHEIEESIVALCHFHQWLQQQNEYSRDTEPVIAVDVCGGKGIFSMLLSYMATNVWQDLPNKRRLNRILLLEKATPEQISWNHIQAANARTHHNPIPTIEVWSDTNLHDYDELIDRFQKLSQQHNNALLALTGIHLCKMLSPAFVGLVNGLGPRQCPYVCLSPCCLPRLANTKNIGNKNRLIGIYKFETLAERHARLEHNLQCQSKSRRRPRVCYICQSPDHWARQCPQLEDKAEDERLQLVAEAAAKTPCWICGQLGHFKADCPTPEDRITLKQPPSSVMDVSDIRATALPYESYCQLLAQHISMNEEEDGRQSTNTESEEGQQPPIKMHKPSSQSKTMLQVLETGLSAGGHQEGNWNNRRKSIYIIASR